MRWLPGATSVVSYFFLSQQKFRSECYERPTVPVWGLSEHPTVPGTFRMSGCPHVGLSECLAVLFRMSMYDIGLGIFYFGFWQAHHYNNDWLTAR